MYEYQVPLARFFRCLKRDNYIVEPAFIVSQMVVLNVLNRETSRYRPIAEFDIKQCFNT